MLMGEADTNYQGLTMLHVCLSLLVVSLFVDLQINLFRSSPYHSAIGGSLLPDSKLGPPL